MFCLENNQWSIFIAKSDLWENSNDFMVHVLVDCKFFVFQIPKTSNFASLLEGVFFVISAHTVTLESTASSLSFTFWSLAAE